MESSTRTGQPEPASKPAPEDVAITEKDVAIPEAPADVAITEIHPSMITEARPSMIAAIHGQCSACGATMASDQRYCVECGQRHGSTRVPLLDGLASRAREEPTAHRAPQRPRMSVNSTLIAGVGTLLLAMGVGVLIGRSGNNNTRVKTPPPEVVTVAGAGGAASSGTATSATATTPASGASAGTSTSSGATRSSAGTKSTSKAASKTSAAPPPKTVKVGSPGHGPGYKNGHFTGNFFGE